MSVNIRKVLKHSNRKRNKKSSVNNRKISNVELYYLLSDLPSPDNMSESY